MAVRGKVWQSYIWHESANEAKVLTEFLHKENLSSGQVFWEDLEVLLDTIELTEVKQNACI